MAARPPKAATPKRHRTPTPRGPVPDELAPLAPGAGSGEGADLIKRNHPEWREHQLQWQWLYDSYEGGQRYRQAVYGYDHRGMPVRNMIRHKREYPDPREMPIQGGSPLMFPSNNPLVSTMGLGAAPGMVGSDPASLATDDPYEFRRARTPVPRFVGQAVDCHLSKIYAREVRRVGPDALRAWWKDVDGTGQSIDEWMQQEVAPLLATYGQIDLIFDHPKAPEGTRIETKADAKQSGIGRCVVGYILPENLTWWKLDDARRYTECVVREHHDTNDGGRAVMYRHWTATGWTLLDGDGQVKEKGDHPFGRVPIVRFFDVRKQRCRNVGQSRYGEIAEIQREFYNRDSELVLSDSLQAHALLQGPEDYCKADAEIKIGPDNLLPKKKVADGNGTSYEGFEFVEPPKGAAESIRANKGDLRDEADRAAGLTKPAGVTGSTGKTVAQSGVSKQLDQSQGNDLLSKLSASLGRLERGAAEMALMVLTDGNPSDADIDAIKIAYPTEFDLFTAKDLADATTEFQAILSLAGEAPETEFALLSRLTRLMLPGLDDEMYKAFDDELEQVLEGKAQQRQAAAEMNAAATAAKTDAITNPEAAVPAPPDDDPAGNRDDGGGTGSLTPASYGQNPSTGQPLYAYPT